MEAADVMRFPTGTFAGLVAEGSRTEFRTHFKPENSKALPLDKINNVTGEEIRHNFMRIKEDAARILGGTQVESDKEPTIMSP